MAVCAHRVQCPKTELKSFKQDYPQSEAYLLYRGKDRLLIDNILCLPCQEFLSRLRPDQTLNACIT